MVYLMTIFPLVLLGVFILYSVYKMESPKQEKIWEEIKNTLRENSIENNSNEAQKSLPSLNAKIRQNKSANDDCYTDEKNHDFSSILAKEMLIHSSNMIKTTTAVARFASSDMATFVISPASKKGSTSFRGQKETFTKAVVKKRIPEVSMFPNFDELGFISNNKPVNLSDSLTKVNLTHS